MIKKTEYVAGRHKQPLFLRRFSAEEGRAERILLILHGMAEYGGRYADFARFLVDKNYIVYVMDHRKHGKSLVPGERVGSFVEDTWEDMVDDAEIIRKHICTIEETDKIAVLGHSMGSFITRHLLIKYGAGISKAVLVGTGDTNKALANVGVQMARLIEMLNKKSPSQVLNKLSVEPYNKPFRPARTKMDWLTRDNQVVDWYINSPLCGYVYPPRFYKEIAKALRYLAKQENISKTSLVPLYFIAGAKDPVGEMGNGVKRVYERYKGLGYEATFDLIPEARHEILNEKNKQETYAMIHHFLENNTMGE